VTALFPVDVVSDGGSSLDFDDGVCSVWYAGGLPRLGDAAAAIYDIRGISPSGHARLDARDADLGRPFEILSAWRDGNGMLFPVFDRLMVAHAELVPSDVSPLHNWLIDSSSSNLNVVSSIAGCWVHTSDVRVSLRRLSGISGAKSGRECMVHLMFGGVPSTCAFSSSHRA
jgi:hypothetical protein